MPPAVQVGTVLIEEGPGMTQLGIESESYSGHWSVVKALNGLTLDRKIHAAGGNYFFMAAEIKVMFFGVLGANKILYALQRILAKVKGHHFNSLEVTGIAARHFLGVPYVTVSAHSRHIQHSCYLDRAETRRTSQHNAEWARG